VGLQGCNGNCGDQRTPSRVNRPTSLGKGFVPNARKRARSGQESMPGAKNPLGEGVSPAFYGTTRSGTAKLVKRPGNRKKKKKKENQTGVREEDVTTADRKEPNNNENSKTTPGARQETVKRKKKEERDQRSGRSPCGPTQESRGILGLQQQRGKVGGKTRVGKKRGAKLKKAGKEKRWHPTCRRGKHLPL